MAPRAKAPKQPVETPPIWVDESAAAGPDPIDHFKAALQEGTPWYIAFLEAAALWTAPQEEYDGRNYQYLLAGEAFDWLLLAERLCEEANGLIPVEEQEALLFHGEPPNEVEPAQLEKILGIPKHRAYMNYWYGVVVEEAIQLAVEDEVHKEQRSKGHSGHNYVEEMAWTRLYNDNPTDLLQRFCQESGRPESDTLGLADMKEFTYWLFKLRVAAWDPARVASDTRKGLSKLDVLRGRA